MVRLEADTNRKGAQKFLYFNSSMVRLEGEGLKGQKKPRPNFNSSMVRLEGPNDKEETDKGRISIPAWYD